MHQPQCVDSLQRCAELVGMLDVSTCANGISMQHVLSPTRCVFIFQFSGVTTSDFDLRYSFDLFRVFSLLLHPPTGAAMTSIVDSRAHFWKRCSDVGMTERATNHLAQNNLDTMGKLAFSIGQPGHPLDANEFAAFAQNTLGALHNQADTAVLKRLVFEGHYFFGFGAAQRTCD